MTGIGPRTIERARTVAALHRAGLTQDVIANRLNLSPRTVARLHTTAKTLPEEAPMPTTDWIRHGACRTQDPELFYPLSYHNDQPEVRTAKATCRACPVQQACLTYALDNPGQTIDGIWGGLTPRERSRARNVRDTETRRTAAA
jgi:WhiB family redox-sensing transcriptional regulator